MPHPPEFRLDGYEAAVEDADSDVTGTAVGLTSLAEHHTDDDRHSYYVLHDESATWGHPGMSHILAVHIRRDHESRRYRCEEARLPLVEMAQSWLTARGCPRTAIGLPPGTGTPPADDATRALEERLVGDGDRFAILAAYTAEGSNSWEITVMLLALDERDRVPLRVLLQHGVYDTWTHTLREGAFATFAQATAWWESYWGGDNLDLPPLPGAAPTRGRSPTPAASATHPPPPGLNPNPQQPAPGPGSGPTRHL
ncbi:hypothetical protein [Streptomyces sp. NPDC088789]|uniref:hypothetical protein n=1 Tax=Streptomyces sp. NPDC088789 TaxID=3365899 RepID=UPI003825A088